MKILTARYYNRNLRGVDEKEKTDDSLIPIATSRSTPRFHMQYTPAAKLSMLAPPKTFDDLDPDEFEDRYRAMLDRIGIEAVMDPIEALCRHRKGVPVLLCFEDIRLPGKWCHRTILGSWLRENGHEVEELPEEEPAQGGFQW